MKFANLASSIGATAEMESMTTKKIPNTQRTQATPLTQSKLLPRTPEIYRPGRSALVVQTKSHFALPLPKVLVLQRSAALPNEKTPLTSGMKRSTRYLDLSDLEDVNSEKKMFHSGTQCKTVDIGKLKDYSKLADRAKARYQTLEILLEEIGNQSKGHQVITNDPDLVEIWYQVCEAVNIDPKWPELSNLPNRRKRCPSCVIL